MNSRKGTYILGPLTLLLVSACGGGGGGGGDTPSVDSSTVPLALTADNAVSVTSEVLGSALTTNDLDFDPVPPIALTVEGNPIRLSSGELLLRSLKSALEPASEGLSGVSGVTVTQPLNCPNGGSGEVTLIATNVNPYVPTAGDQIKIDANNCIYSEQVDDNTLSMTVDGIAIFTLETPSGIPPRTDFPTHASWANYSLIFTEQDQLQCTFQNYHITLSGPESLSMTLDGDLELKAGINATADIDYYAMSGNAKLHMVSTAATLDFRLDSLDLEGLSRMDGNGLTFDEVRYNTSYSSHTLGGVGGKITINTIDNLIHDGTTNVSLVAGHLKISGAAGSSVTVLIPGPASDVQLAIDSNGDAIIDRTLDLNWAELNGQ